MSTNTLVTRSAGDVITASFFNDFNSALENDVVGRDSSGVPAAGKNLGTASLPWGTIRANSIVVNGSTLDPTTITAPQNRVISGQTRTTSNQPAFLKPNGAANSLTIEGATTNLVLDINGTTVTVSSTLSKTGLTVAPATQNTATVNDATAAGQEATRTWGEYQNSTDITITSAGTNITNLIGKFAAFKIVDGGNTEYFVAFVESATLLSKCMRGFFYDSTYAPKNRIKFSNSDTITLMSWGFVFVENNGSTVDVTYTVPTWSFVSPTSPATGDYWFDFSINQWKRYDGASFVIINRTIVGTVVLDSSNAVAARSWDIFKPYKEDNYIEVDKVSNTVLRASDLYQMVNVYGNVIQFEKSLPTWDITTQLASSADMYNAAEQASTYYYLYIKDTGAAVLSDISPHWRPDFQGYYHPHNPWRMVATAFNDSGSNLANVISLFSPVPNSRVSVSNGNGHGSTNTFIRRFSTTNETTGSDITYADSSTLGASFTINRKGVYQVQYTDGKASSDNFFGISLNTTAPTSSINGLTWAQGFRAAAISANVAGGQQPNLGCTLFCLPGDVIRPHTDSGVTNGSLIASNFTVTRVA